ncbi:hypothetical protein BDZ85DRAFT_312700 [Elsinoe ampelina]|uniref:Flavin-containing monooxygenase n=1 Tax=Elsinoe ampelina TaxID=302913 RepID=A0A6A6GBX4_9PEZI|nr:hypothetical protein BDZ85DRAFT_312700 [Elsinoe ampelina]
MSIAIHSNMLATRRFLTKGGDLKGTLPVVSFERNVDAQSIAITCVERLSNLKPTDLLADSLWKDNVCIAGTFRTFHSSNIIASTWVDMVSKQMAEHFCLIPHTAHTFELAGVPAWISAGFSFSMKGSPSRQCSGFLNAAPDDHGIWKIFSLTTILEAIDGFPNPDTPPSTGPLPAKDGVFDCLVVGAGACGLCLGARLQSVGLSYLVVDKHTTVGDVWRKRYDSTKLHLNSTFSDFPYERLLDPNKYYPTGVDMANAHQAFAEQWRLNIQNSTEVKSAKWHPDSKTWTIQVIHSGNEDTIVAKHLVMATGSGISHPITPSLANRETFHGTVLHTSDWKNAHPFTGKRGIVIGSANSAFDIIEDMVLANLSSVTMIQRSRTRVINGKHFRQLTDPLYNKDSNIELSDRLMMATPYQHGRLMTMANVAAMQAGDQGRYKKLGQAGFRYEENTDFNGDYMERGGGHYLDVGQTRYIEDGRVGVRSGFEAVAFTEDGVRLASGEVVEGDVVVFATGFRFGMKEGAMEIVGEEIGGRLDEFWGLDENGDTRGLAKPIGHPNIWYLGGGTGHARFYSRFLALQILADVMGSPFVPYSGT